MGQYYYIGAYISLKVCWALNMDKLYLEQCLMSYCHPEIKSGTSHSSFHVTSTSHSSRHNIPSYKYIKMMRRAQGERKNEEEQKHRTNVSLYIDCSLLLLTFFWNILDNFITKKPSSWQPPWFGGSGGSQLVGHESVIWNLYSREGEGPLNQLSNSTKC